MLKIAVESIDFSKDGRAYLGLLTLTSISICTISEQYMQPTELGKILASGIEQKLKSK